MCTPRAREEVLMYRNMLIVTGSVVLLLCCARAVGGDELVARTSAHQDVRQSFAVSGKVAKVLVEPGAKVAKGQVLAELDREEARLGAELARIRAEGEVEVRIAEHRLDRASQTERRIRQLVERDAASSDELNQAAMDVLAARLELQRTEQVQAEARQVYLHAQERLKKYSLIASVDGTVESVAVSEGEMVRPGQPVVRIINAEALLVEAPMLLDQARALEVGGPVWIVSTASSLGTEAVEGRILSVSSVLDPESQTRAVRIRVSNDAGFLPGSKVEVHRKRPGLAAGARGHKVVEARESLGR